MRGSAAQTLTGLVVLGWLLNACSLLFLAGKEWSLGPPVVPFTHSWGRVHLLKSTTENSG